VNDDGGDYAGCEACYCFDERRGELGEVAHRRVRVLYSL